MGCGMDVDIWAWERRYWGLGYKSICGCDEAGAGPLAGPVYAAAVILPEEQNLPGLDDSKKLTPNMREMLFEQIQRQAAAWSVAWVSPEEIDASDILSARLNAMQRAIDGLRMKADFALIDGNRDRGRTGAITTSHVTIIKGDNLSASIAAASILAKVSRDRYMVDAAKEYPQYGFEQHKGYPTKLHYERLRQYGPCPIHRRTFLKKL